MARRELEEKNIGRIYSEEYWWYQEQTNEAGDGEGHRGVDFFFGLGIGHDHR